MEPDIVFSYEHVLYSVEARACTLNRIVLPDKRMLVVKRWLADPPIPEGLHEEPHMFNEMEPDKIAMLVNGIAAKFVQGV